MPLLGIGSLFRKTTGLTGLMKKPAGAAEEEPHYDRSTRRQSLHNGAAAAMHLLGDAGHIIHDHLPGHHHHHKPTTVSPPAKYSITPPNPALKRTLTRKFTRANLVSVAPSPEQIAAANAADLGEVVIEVVLASGLKKATRVGTPAPSPLVKLAVRGNEQRSKKQERTLFPMWNERLVWKGKRGELCTPKMLVEVLAWDPLTPTSMGRAEVDIAELLVGSAIEMMVALGEGLGSLQLRGSWMARERGKVHASLESAP